MQVPDPKQPLPPMDASTRRARLLDFMRRLVRTAGRDRLTLILLAFGAGFSMTGAASAARSHDPFS